MYIVTYIVYSAGASYLVTLVPTLKESSQGWPMQPHISQGQEVQRGTHRVEALAKVYKAPTHFA